jgi:hypothetical protein
MLRKKLKMIKSKAITNRWLGLAILVARLKPYK